MGILKKTTEKIKGLFVEEINEPKVEIKKEVIKVEIPAPEEQIKEEKEVVEEVKPEIKEEPKEEEPIKETAKPEQKVYFPRYFSEEDFSDIKKEEKELRAANSREERSVRTSFQRDEFIKNDENDKPSFRDVYGRQKDETTKTYTPYKEKEPKKPFKPTPIISPVYGILDKNYSKEDITTTKRPTRLSSEYTSDKVTIDDVRKKAYGTLEDDIETSLLGQFDSVDETNSEELFNDIEEENKDNLMADELLNSFDDEFDDSYTKNVLDDVDTTDIDEKLSRDYNVEMPEEKEIIKEETKKKTRKTKKIEDIEEKDDEEDIDITESDLFNLIDSWYEKRDEE